MQQMTSFDYQAIALKKLYTQLFIDRIGTCTSPRALLTIPIAVNPDDRPIQLNLGSESNTSEERKVERMKDERSNNTRDAMNRDGKRNPMDFDPGKKAAAPNQNDDPELHELENKRALELARHNVTDVLMGIGKSDEERMDKGNELVRQNRERMERNPNLPLKDLVRSRGVTPVSTRTVTNPNPVSKDGIIDAIQQRLSKPKKEDKESK